MTSQLEPEAARRIEDAVRKLASMEYPCVWIGEEGMTAAELLHIQMLNEEMPEWMRVEPGELVQMEGDEEGHGIQVPEVSHRWVDGLWVYENMPHALPGHELAELELEVLHVYAAKQNKVLVQALLKEGEDIWHRHREPLEGLVVARHFDPDSYTPGYTVLIRLVPLNRLTLDDVNEEFFNTLEFFAAGGDGIEYVIEDTEQARRALEERLNS
jgi:hypothetical protein